MRQKNFGIVALIVIPVIIVAFAVVIFMQDDAPLETKAPEPTEVNESAEAFMEGGMSLGEYIQNEITETGFAFYDETGTKSDIEMQSYKEDVVVIADSFNKKMFAFDPANDYSDALTAYFNADDGFNASYKEVVGNIWQTFKNTDTEVSYSGTEYHLLKAEEVDGCFCLHLTSTAKFHGKSNIFEEGDYRLYETISFYNISGEWIIWAVTFGEVYPEDSFAFAYDEATDTVYTKGGRGIQWSFSTPEKYAEPSAGDMNEMEQYAMENNLTCEMYADGTVIWKDMDGNVVEGPQ